MTTAAVVSDHNRPRRWRPPPTLPATRCVFELVETTTLALVVKRKPCVHQGAARHREALRRAKVLTATDPTTLDIRSGDFYKDFAAESRLACLESKKDIRSFDEAQARGREGQPSGERRRQEPTPEAWSPDAAKLSEAAMTAASQPGGLGTGPRVTLSDTYRSFRVLNLGERNITTINPAFAHFENLTELDLGRNRLRKLENLPEGIVSLSCAANELSGRALDGVSGLPLLCSLDLSFNNLEVHSLLPPPKAKLPRRRLLHASGHNIGDGPAEPTNDGGDGDYGVQRQFRRPAAPPPLATGEKHMHFQEKFSSLEHLDISWNCLCDLDRLLHTLIPLQDTLRHLFLAGNPFCLVPAYRERVLGRGCGPGLVVLDDLPISPVEYRSAVAAAAAVEKAQDGCIDGVRGNEDEADTKHRRRKGSFEAVHFHVKLLRLSELPDLGTTSPEPTRSTDSAAVAATPPAAGAGKAGAVRGDTVGNIEETGDEEEPSPPKQWGDVEFVVPGDTHDSDTDASTTRTGWFSWASEVVPPPPEPPEVDNNDGRCEQPETEQGTVDSAAPGTGNDGERWEVSVAAPPSREMRDGVRFQGLCVLLFVGDDERETEGEEEAFEEGASPPAEAVNDGDSVGIVDSFNPTDEPTYPPGDEGHVEGEARDQDKVSPQALPSRRRRLAGRGYLSLANFLDPAWMMQEQQQPPPQQRQQERGGDVKETEAVVTAAEDGEAGGRTGAPAGARTVFGVNGGAASPATISGECNVVLEPWVVETMREGVARRKRERLERKEAERAEAEANAANDPKGKNAKAAAAAAAAAKLQKGDDDEEEAEQEEIGPSPSARAEVEVTLNGAWLR